MADDGGGVPETHVLAIASHVTSGYVGNTMATFCMQTLGCEVSAIHTVNYSNHVGYGRVKGRKSTPEEVEQLYRGLKEAHLNSFDVLLSGYCPSAALVDQVGVIARERKLEANNVPGSFFWVLDPVMGDNGRIYVAEDTVPAYRSLLKDADLILPNQFEAELLTDVKIRDLPSMRQAIAKLHQAHHVAHVLITSIRLPPTQASTPNVEKEHPAYPPSSAKLSVVGSSATSKGQPRLFRITIPAIPVYFSGTGDMFSAILVARLREAVKAAGLLDTDQWRSPDDVAAPDLPLAKATEKVLASMHVILKDTAEHYNAAAEGLQEQMDRELNQGAGDDGEKERETEKHLKLTKAAEVRVVRNAQALRDPPNVGDFRAQPVDIGDDEGEDDKEVEGVKDDLGVLKVTDGEGAVHQM